MNLIEQLGAQSIFLYELYFIYSFMAFKNNFSFYMVLAILINILINIATKTYFFNMTKSTGHHLPIIGNLCRPMDTACKAASPFNFGFPSGHSQIAWFIPAFYYFYYRNTSGFSRNIFALYSTIAVFIMTTRVTAGKHSIPQVIVGGLYGCGIGYAMAMALRFFQRM
jgi:membrane-associated phospholipid phosphatase